MHSKRLTNVCANVTSGIGSNGFDIDQSVVTVNAVFCLHILSYAIKWPKYEHFKPPKWTTHRYNIGPVYSVQWENDVKKKKTLAKCMVIAFVLIKAICVKIVIIIQYWLYKIQDRTTPKILCVGCRWNKWCLTLTGKFKSAIINPVFNLKASSI